MTPQPEPLAPKPAPEPERPPSAGRIALALVLGAALVLGGVWGLVRYAGRPYLADGDASWIVYPTVFVASAQSKQDRTTEFRRTFTAGTAPAAAVLRARGFGRVAVKLNGVPVAETDGEGLTVCVADVTAHVRPGENHLTARVTNAAGPPALCLELAADGAQVVTDPSWEASLFGAAWLPARRAADPLLVRGGNPVAGGERPAAALAAQAPALLAFAGAAGLVIAGAGAVARRPRPRWASDGVLLAAAVAGCWTALFAWNARFLTRPIGYDAALHLEYVQFVHDRGELPLANQGLEMQQPPLYYVLAAAALRAAGVAPDGGEACGAVLRGLGLVTGLAGLLFVGLILRRVFPDRPLPQVVGLVVAAALPPHLYEVHYLSNDLLAGALGTAALYLTVVMLQRPSPGWLLGAGVGACVGLAVLAKLTALPLAVAVFAVLAARAVARRSGRAAVRELGVPLLACALVCGGFFARNVAHFGRPIVGTYEQDIGRWWQDPGYVSLGQLSRFGAALSDPTYAMTTGVPDGLYCTLWGDGAWGGEAAKAFRPPWRYELMAAGYALALVPTVLAAVGWGAGAARWVRRPTAQGALLLLVPVGAVTAVCYHYAGHPFYCHVKAFYALPAVAALCAAAGSGFEVLAAGSRRRQWALGVALGVWAFASAGAFVIPDAASTDTYTGYAHLTQGNGAAALEAARRAVRADGKSADARVLLASVLSRDGNALAAATEWRRAAELAPDDRAVRRWRVSDLLLRGQIPEAVRACEEAIASQPDDDQIYLTLANVLSEARQDYARAARVARAGLQAHPTSPDIHTVLARALVRLGDTDGGVRHYRFALRFAPNSVPAMIGLAWVLAAHEDARVRDDAEARRLVERAEQVSGQPTPSSRRAAAAAAAASGDFRAAEAIAAPVLKVLEGANARDLDRVRHELEAYRAGRALRDTRLTVPDR